MSGNRIIYQEDALKWLGARGVLSGCSVVTSLPDYSEFPELNLGEWKAWFKNAARVTLASTSEEGAALFYQTDIIREGLWIDKAFLIQSVAEDMNLIFHKIICRDPAGSVAFGRPTYSHLIGFSKSIKPIISKSRADVLADAGEVSWTRGMGKEACRLACQLVLDHTTTRTIVDPFCGHGGVLAMANQMEMDAIGVELSPKRARKARNLNWCETIP